jgi:DNA polymerase-3 subunit gamma/tau
MDDSGDMFGDRLPAREEAPPSAAELEDAGQSVMFGEAEPASEKPSPPSAQPQTPSDAPPAQEAPESGPAQPYRVLARKYRPQTFSQLLGQEPMVRTLANAIARERLAHAFLMTGVRGVGKTSTARLIAKALNCIGPDGQGGPTIDPCGECEPCRAIAEGRHIDVIEMDAASHTGVDDVREIIEAVRYSAVSARYKIYIIDEVHMLSRNAFNALLKTLEEPPPHVKFLFATTEVDKLPVTVLSRTQRFDLRRISAPMLEQHFASICRQEGVEADAEALALIASAAEGSVRDGLSILDQAIAHADMESSDGDKAGQARVTAERVRDMLGLADKGAQRRLFASLLEGDPQSMLESVDRQYALGVEPLALMRAMMELTHRIAVTQVGRGEPDAPTQEERDAIDEWARKLSIGQVHRLWQLLLKGYEEVRGAPDPLVAAQMALLRVLHAADMPDPGKLADTLRELAASGAGSHSQPAGDRTAQAAPALGWAELVDRIEQSGALHLANRLRMQVRIVALEPGRLVFTQAQGFDEDLAPELRAALVAVTNRRWAVEKGAGDGLPTIVEQEQAHRSAQDAAMREHELVKAALAAFPGAEFVEEDEAPRGRSNWNKRV